VISRAVVVPNPPLLIPELVGDAIEETEPLRTSCLLAARRLAQASQDWIAIGTGAMTRQLPAGRAGTFRGFGVDRNVRLSTADALERDPDLPLSALVAGWLREQAGAREVRMELLAPDAGTAELAALVERASRTGRPVGLLVLGDGSNRHGQRSPGYADDRAPGFDDAVADALRSADPKALLALDAELAGQLGAGGYPVWQALGLVALADGRDWKADLLYSDAPFGVGYHVAVWDPV
jgi:hypothetical protein